MPRRRGGAGGGRAQFGRASIVDVLNSNSSDDSQARSHVLKVFIPLLIFIFALDIGCAIAMILIQCNGHDNDNDNGDDDNDDIDETAMTCFSNNLKNGFDLWGDHDGLGDLLFLALVRCIVTIGLLWMGVNFNFGGNNENCGSDSGEIPHTSATTTASSSASATTTIADNTNSTKIGSSTPKVQEEEKDNGDSLTEPLLNNHDHQESTLQVQNNNNMNINDTQENQLESQTNMTGDQNNQCPQDEINTSSETQPSIPSESIPNKCISKTCYVCTDLGVKNISLVLLFVSSTFFQVYAGLKVSMFQPKVNMQPALPPLMCLSILWINAISYIFRVLLEELTREEALFLPPTVHRHPVFYEESRSINLHWCDICRQRIVSLNNGNVGCYRCSLCDFDICLQCARRNDAATIGEDLLRTDRGVRVETSLDNSSYFLRSWKFVKSELCLLLISIGFLVCNSMTKLLLPHFQGKIIDQIVPDEDGNIDRQGFATYIKIYVVVMILQGAVSTMYSAIFTFVSRRLKFSIRNSLFKSILSQDIAFFDGTESGRLISRLTNDLDLMMSPIQSSLSSLLNNILILIGGMLMCFVKSYRLSMLAFVTVGPITYLWNLYADWSKGLAREMLAYWAEGNSIASQALSHIRTIKAFGCESRVMEKYSEANKEALDRGIKDAWGNGLTSALTGYLDLGAGILILYFGGLLVLEGAMTVGELVTFQLFWNMMNNAYQNLQGLITSFTRSAAGAEKVFSLYDSIPDIDPSAGSDISSDVKGELELKNVKFYYQMRPDNIVLQRLNLIIPSGKTIALVGPSGGGKTTIINLLLRFYDAKEGKLLIDGQEYPSIKVSQLRKLFGVVTQETELFSLTVEENIAYGLKKDEYTMDELISAAKKAQAYDFIVQMKDGFQTRIGERGNRLSGGQRQRIAIARVFLRKPKILLLDEATSALDENNQEAVQDALNTLIAESNATVVVVAHRLSTVMNADSIVVIAKGTVLEQGTHSDLVEKGGLYAMMVQKQEKKNRNNLKEDNSLQ